MTRQYTNELAPAILAAIDQLPFKTEQLVEMNSDARALVAVLPYQLSLTLKKHRQKHLFRGEGNFETVGKIHQVEFTNGIRSMARLKCMTALGAIIWASLIMSQANRLSLPIHPER